MGLLKSDDFQERPHSGGKPPIEITDLMRVQVRKLMALGLTQAQIADVLDIGESTLKRRFPDELAAGIEDFDGAVVRNLRKHALGDGPGSVTAGIFWTKARLGWSERLRLEHSFGPVVEKMVSGLTDLLHRAIPDFCPACRTALNLKPEIAKLLIEESKKLTGEAAAAASAAVPAAGAEAGA